MSTVINNEWLVKSKKAKRVLPMADFEYKTNLAPAKPDAVPTSLEEKQQVVDQPDQL